MFLELLKLPVAIQLGLASGYAGYHFAYVGIREHHKTIDVAFITLVFGLVATVIFFSIIAIEENLKFTGIFGDIVAGLFAFTGSLGAGIVWRKWGRKWLHEDLRKSDVSWSNDDPSALRTITATTDYYFTQVGVLLQDGTWLLCENAGEFGNAPFGPIAIGQNGDVALYLTHEQKPKARKPKLLTTVRNADWGDRITYIPSNQIRRITIRMKPRI